MKGTPYSIKALVISLGISMGMVGGVSLEAQTRPVDPAQRPVTLPSYPDRPVANPPVRPPIRPPVRPPYRPDVYPGYQYPTVGTGYANTIRCESYARKFRNCYVRTRGRVVLERRHNGRCRYGNGWGYDRNRIWVNNNCRATFAYGVGSYRPNYRNDKDNTGAVIGGVVVAAGLIAILASAENDRAKKSETFPPQTSATIYADMSGVRSSVRPALQQCLEKASQNVAATGGTSIELTDVTFDSLGGSTYRLDVDVRAQYPDKMRKLAFNCTASASEVEDFDFVTD